MVAKILVIEDEDETREIFLQCLTFEKFTAIGAKDGESGVELAVQHQPDLIVCDIMMPGMDGYRVLTVLRQKEALLAIPFIFLTAKVTMEDLRRGMTLGADDYLTKPCTIEQFLSAISTRLQRAKEIQRSKVHTSTPDTAINIFPNCPKLTPVFQFIDAHYRQSIQIDDVARAAGYSPAYLTNLSQSHTGKTVKKWITERRMAQARQMLRSTAQSVKQISEETGYSDAGYFIRQFRKLHGTTPKAWRSDCMSSSVSTTTKQSYLCNNSN